MLAFISIAILASATAAVPRVAVDNFGPDLSHRSYAKVSSDQGFLAQSLPPLAQSLAFMQEQGFSNSEDYVISSQYASPNGVHHVHLKQVVNGLLVENGVMNLNLFEGSIHSMGSSFYSVPAAASAATRAQTVLGFKPDDAGHNEKPVTSWADSRLKVNPAEALASLVALLKLDPISPESLVITSESPIHKRKTHFKVSGFAYAVKEVPVTLKYLQTEDKQLRLVWDMEVEMADNWYHVHVDTETGKVLSLVDWVADATYNVFPLGTNDPECGDRVLVKDPENPLASPYGWHFNGQKNYSVTIGNNVLAQENLDGKSDWQSNHRPKSTSKKELLFSFPVDLKKEPKSYIDAAVTNLFYWNNMIHDLFYQYGFNEVAGNFQHENFNRGGKGGDPVIAHAQDGSGYNNANFATPPDGRSGRMRMYVWDSAEPMRDGDLEGGIIMHEYGHGISIRLTGGPQNVGCLGWGESGGMGEGWGDFFATILRMTPNTTRDDVFTMGSYANGGHGIRKFPYSTDMKVNPSTYSLIARPDYWGVHRKGEVWAEILFQVYWDMVDKHGFDPDWFNTAHLLPPNRNTDFYLDIKSGLRKKKPKKPKQPSPSPIPDPDPRKPSHAGNIMFLQLVVDGLKLQPCYPTFIDARDAIIHADEINNKGDNFCTLWKGFAFRGLGVAAKSGGRQDFDVPPQCKEKTA